MMTFEDETAIESRASCSLLPDYCLESSALSSVYNHQLSPADTVRDDGDGTRDTPAEFRLRQCFGEYSTNGEVAQADTLSTVQFDSSGKYLATGDRGGRVVIFRKNDDEKMKETPSGKMRRIRDFKFFTEFQSHEAEFDYLKSLDIKRKINAIKWYPKNNDALFVLSTNDKTVKLWKVREKKVKTFACAEQSSIKGGRDKSELVLPNMSVTGTTIASSLRRTFANGHAYHINSIDPSSDGEHFISADDLRINLWNLNVTDRSFNILDMKPKSMEELTEVITAATFHPSHSNVFLYSSSRGCIKIGDMRAAALCDQHAKVLDKPSDVSMKSFFSEIVASISDMKMTSDGRFIFSRDYMTLKLWDVNMEAKPLKIINVHEHLRPKLCDLYNKDYIFDKFECAINKDASTVVTGTYGNKCNLYDRNGQSMKPLEVCKEATTTGSKKAKRQFIRDNSQQALIANSQQALIDNGEVDYEKKILHMSWHPMDDIIAVAGKDKLFIYDGTSKRSDGL